jgi:hypothetical protein
MNRQLLNQPFNAHEIRQREGSNGKILDYVEGHVVVARLNDALDGEWSFEVIDYGIDSENDEVRCLGKLTAGNVVKMQFGSSAITRNRKDNKPVSIGDDLKASATDALKKASTLLGVGLSLYSGKTEPRTQSAPSPDPVPAPTPPSSPTTPGRLSSKQHSYLLTLSRGHGLTRREVDALCIERFGVVLDHVTRSEASLLIEELTKQETPSQPPQNEHRNHTGGIH